MTSTCSAYQHRGRDLPASPSIINSIITMTSTIITFNINTITYSTPIFFTTRMKINFASSKNVLIFAESFKVV